MADGKVSSAADALPDVYSSANINKRDNSSTTAARQQASANNSTTSLWNCPLQPAVMARVPGLQRLPSLTLEELDRAQEAFTTVLGERKESITTAFELRVLLGLLGLYPSEEEMALVVSAARERVNFTALTHYLRFCKREFEVAVASDAASGGGGGGRATTSSGKRQQQQQGGGDADTLRAFIALGGNEDGGGKVSTARLVELVREFQLTIDIEAMIESVDTDCSGAVDYLEFRQLWALPDGPSRRASLIFLSGASSPTANGVITNNSNGVGSRASALPQAANWGTMTGNPARNMFASGGRRRSSVLIFSSTPTPTAGVSPRSGAKASHAATGGGGGNGGTRSQQQQAGAAPQPLSETDRYLLLHVYLHPEQHEGATAGRNGNGNGNGNGDRDDEGLLPLLDRTGAAASSSRRRGNNCSSRDWSQIGRGTMRVGRGCYRPGRGCSPAGALSVSAVHGGADDPAAFQQQQKTNAHGVYQPPSPMILSQHRHAARRARRALQQQQQEAATAALARSRGAAAGAGGKGTITTGAGGAAATAGDADGTGGLSRASSLRKSFTY